jgi:hypothetical protein
MTNRKCVFGLALFAMASLAPSARAADQYNFFARARYPGLAKAPGVDIYKVQQTGGDHADGYQRRVVNWWPRKGVDVIEVNDAMGLRTWTLRDRKMDPGAVGEHLILGIETLTRRLSWKWKQIGKFKARLIGFRGIGNRYGNPFEPEKFHCPAVVLLLENGTRRCFTRGTFVEADEQFILALYLKEMARLRAAGPKDKFKLVENRLSAWPDNAKPGQPGTMRVESDHIVWVSGSQHAPNEKYSPWVNRDYPEKARLYREGSVSFGEDMWTYHAYSGVLMPYWDRTEQHKYVVTVVGTYRDGHKWLGGFAGGGYGGCGIKYAGGGPWGLVLAHEWGHGLPISAPVGAGGGETVSDACQTICDPAAPMFYENAKRPWRNCMHEGYGTCLFYAIMGDDPNWAYTMAITLPRGQGEMSVFHTLARIGEQRGLFANGIRGVGDMMGEFAARQAEFDCEIRENLRRDHISVKRNWLQAVDRKAGLYRIPWSESPEMFGANIIRLLPEKGAAEISVDFSGFYDADTHGDWRACIVVVGADGKVRYSPLWNKGVMKIAIGPTDRRFWLTVAATPSALPTPQRGGVGAMLYGRHAYRYPYEVKLTGCRPGTPHNLPGDVEDYGLTYLGGFRNRFDGGVCVIPHPGDSPEAAILGKAVAPLRAKVDEVKEATKRFIAEDKIDTKHWRYLRRFRPHLAFLDNYVNWMQDGVKGARHPNGGGWVSASATVAPTAYVAPDAMVLYGAKVLDNAAIEDYAVVKGPKTVISGHAKVSGQAYVAGDVKIGGFTRVVHPVISEDTQVSPNEAPLRPFQEKDDGEKLWANYAMDRDETEVLEDWFRYKGNHGVRRMFYMLNLNGHLYGKPKSFIDGARRGFAFDGKTQYAEAAPNLADLGRITVDIALKSEGRGAQTIFDFGSSPDNCFVLRTARNGKPEFVAQVNGKTVVTLAGDKAISPNEWISLRVEIDGDKASLWIDGQKVAQKASGFRPPDVYSPGAEKRNFIAANRDAAEHFKGKLDYLRVYYAVYNDFAKAPAPRRHAPRRVTQEFIDTSSKLYEGSDAARSAAINAKLKPEYAFYEEMGARRGKLLKEIEDAGSQTVAEANRKLNEINKKLSQRTSELRAEFEKLPETMKKQAEYRKLEDQARQLDIERRKAIKEFEGKHKIEKNDRAERQRIRSLAEKDPTIARLTREINALRTQARAHRPDARPYAQQRTIELRRQVAKAGVAVRDAIKQNAASRKPEYDWLTSLGWLAFSRHYNYPYRAYMSKKIGRTVGGKICHENYGALKSLIGMQDKTQWRSKCDWEWRLKKELDGSIKDLPLMRKWLVRVRGKIGDR